MLFIIWIPKSARAGTAFIAVSKREVNIPPRSSPERAVVIEAPICGRFEIMPFTNSRSTVPPVAISWGPTVMSPWMIAAPTPARPCPIDGAFAWIPPRNPCTMVVAMFTRDGALAAAMFIPSARIAPIWGATEESPPPPSRVDVRPVRIDPPCCARSRRGPSRTLKMLIFKSSKADFNLSTSPCRLSIWIAYICSAAPALSAMKPLSSSNLFPESLTMSVRPPKRIAACSALIPY